MLAKYLFVLSVAAIAHGRVVVKERQAAAASNIVFDGRVKAAATQADFDLATGPFGNKFVKGQSKYFVHSVAWNGY